MTRLRHLLTLLFLLCWSWGAWAQPASFHLVQWSDIHGGGKFYSESSMASALAGLASRPDGLLITGDFCDNSHDPQDFYVRLRESLHGVANRISKFKGPLFLAMGNDDMPHNYQSPPADVQQTVNCFREAFGSRCYLDDMGNGVSPSNLGGMKWISINSVYFGGKNTTPQAAGQATKTFAWLRKQLPPAPDGEEASKLKAPPVVIACHIPPLWDLVLKGPSWKPEYIQQLQEIVSQYPGQVFILCGHYHRNHIQAIERNREPAVVLTSGALATKYGYRSNWRDLSFRENDEGRVLSLSYTIHYPENNSWDASYRIVPAKIDELFRNILGNDALFRRYVADIFGHSDDWQVQAADGKIKDGIRDEFWLHTGSIELAPATP